MATAVHTTYLGNGFADRIRALFSEFKAARANRALFRITFNELSSLSDRDLADLGFSRYDIARIAKEHVYGK